jgi:hypothetical protein
MKENTNMAKYQKTMRDAMLEVSVKEKKLLSVTEKLEVSDGLGAWIDDFKKSDAPQFKGKSDEEKKNMAIAAFAGAGGKLKEGVDVDEANLPPHLAKFFDKKGNPKPEVAKRMSNAAKAKKAVVKDVTPKGYGPKEDLDVIHNEALKENESVLESIEWKVKLKGLPMFYVPAKNAGEVRSMLRRQIKKPDDIISIERSTKTAKKKDFRDRASEK